MFQIKLNDFVHETACDNSVWNLFDHVVKKKTKNKNKTKKLSKFFQHFFTVADLVKPVPWEVALFWKLSADTYIFWPILITFN